MILFTKFRTGSLDYMRRGSNVDLRKNNNKIMTNPTYISLRNCPGRSSSFRRFGARCDDARHCEQNGVVFEANFFAKVIEKLPAPELRACLTFCSVAIPEHARKPASKEFLDAELTRYALPQRVVASNFFKMVLRKRRYSRCKCTGPRRLKALARGTQELLATAPHI